MKEVIDAVNACEGIKDSDEKLRCTTKALIEGLKFLNKERIETDEGLHDVFLNVGMQMMTMASTVSNATASLTEANQIALGNRKILLENKEAILENKEALFDTKRELLEHIDDNKISIVANYELIHLTGETLLNEISANRDEIEDLKRHVLDGFGKKD